MKKAIETFSLGIFLYYIALTLYVVALTLVVEPSGVREQINLLGEGFALLSLGAVFLILPVFILLPGHLTKKVLIKKEKRSGILNSDKEEKVFKVASYSLIIYYAMNVLMNSQGQWLYSLISIGLILLFIYFVKMDKKKLRYNVTITFAILSISQLAQIIIPFMLFLMFYYEKLNFSMANVLILVAQLVAYTWMKKERKINFGIWLTVAFLSYAFITILVYATQLIR